MKKLLLIPILALILFSCEKPEEEQLALRSKTANRPPSTTDTIETLLGTQWKQDTLFSNNNKQYYNITTISKDSTVLVESYYFEQDSLVFRSGFPFTKENKVSVEVKYVIELFEGSIGKLEYYSPDTIKTSYSSTFNGVTNSGTNTYLRVK